MVRGITEADYGADSSREPVSLPDASGMSARGGEGLFGALASPGRPTHPPTHPPISEKIASGKKRNSSEDFRLGLPKQ